MLLSEKEIERLITAFVGVSLQYPMDEPPELEEWPIATIFNMDKAARAIAEGMKAGVVWSESFIAKVEEREGYEFDYVTLLHGDSRIQSLMHKGIKDGKTYRVTVRLEGET